MNISRLYRGGKADNEITRGFFGSLILRVLWFANGKHRTEMFSFGDWEKVTPEMAKSLSLGNNRMQVWFQENTDLWE